MEQLTDLGVVIKLSTLIQKHTFVGALGGVFFKELSQPLNGRSLGDTGRSVFLAGEVVKD